jgi:hypothetical protein
VLLDGIVSTADGVQFAERFVGQGLEYNSDPTIRVQANLGSGDIGPFDRLTGAPPAATPLALQPGAQGRNIGVSTWSISAPTSIFGAGSAAYGSSVRSRRALVGEGSLAVLFPFDVSEVAVFPVDPDVGSLKLSFFKRDGNPLGVFDIDLATAIFGWTNGAVDWNTALAFRQAAGEIAGFSLENHDHQGANFYLQYRSVTPASVASTPVPIPGAAALLGSALLGLGGWRRTARAAAEWIAAVGTRR